MGVTGIGGFFFRAKDPEGLGKWYAEHLGVGGSGQSWFWMQDAGPTVFSPFGSDTSYFAADKDWMLNLRVNGLDDLVARLEANGIAITIDPAWNTPETGRFARIHDPEGNPIELWEPPAG